MKTLYDISQLNPESILLYIHSNRSNLSRIPNHSEQFLLRSTIYHYNKTLKLFENQNINKVGLFPSSTGFFWFNFFWIRAKCITKEPEICENKFYYQSYISNGSYHDCYSLIDKKVCYFIVDNAMCCLNTIKQITKHYCYFEKSILKVFYGDVDVSKKVLSLAKDDCIYIPNNSLREELFETSNSIFINNKEYPIYSKIYIYNYNTVYQIDELPEQLKKLLTLD